GSHCCRATESPSSARTAVRVWTLHRRGTGNRLRRNDRAVSSPLILPHLRLRTLGQQPLGEVESLLDFHEALHLERDLLQAALDLGESSRGHRIRVVRTTLEQRCNRLADRATERDP